MGPAPSFIRIAPHVDEEQRSDGGQAMVPPLRSLHIGQRVPA